MDKTVLSRNAVIAVASLLSCYASYLIHIAAIEDAALPILEAILNFEGRAPDQYRILPYLIIKGINAIASGFGESSLRYSVLSFDSLFLFLSAVAIDRSLLRGKSPKVIWYLLLAYPFLMFGGYRPTSSFILFLSVVATFSLRGINFENHTEKRLFAPLILIISFSRADVALLFAFAAIGCSHLRRSTRTILILVPVAVQVLISRVVFPDAEYYSDVLMVADNLSLSLLAGSPLTYLIIAICIIFRKETMRFMRLSYCNHSAPTLAAAGYVILLFVVARVNEFRLFLPLLPLVLWFWEDQSGSVNPRESRQIRGVSPQVRLLLESWAAQLFSKLEKFFWSNGGGIALAIALFMANQLVELLFLLWEGQSYTGLCGWDCGWYRGVVEQGYHLEPQAHERGDAANWAFFPAFPMAGWLLSETLGFSPGLSLILVSKSFFLASIFGFMKLTKSYCPWVPSGIAGALVAFNPYSIYGNVGYTESMFLFFTCLTFVELKKGNVLAAGMVGGVLSATRFVGVFFVISSAVSGLRNFSQGNIDEKLQYFLAMALVPLGLSLFMVYLYFLTGDAFAFSHIQVAWNRVPQLPTNHIVAGLSGDFLGLLMAGMSTVALIFVLILHLRRQHGLAIFSLFATLIPLSTGLLAMPRYIWWQAPLLLVLADLLSRRRLWIIFFPLSICGLLFMYHAWFAGDFWVI